MILIDLEQVKRVNYLLGLLNTNYSEITEPPGGWLSEHKMHVKSNSDGFGKFFIRNNAIIDYMHTTDTITNLQNYHPSLLNLAILQLERRCSVMLYKKSCRSSFPNLHHLLLKYYGIN